MRSYLEEQGIACQLRNEHSSSVMGEVSFFLVWPELWVADENAKEALSLIKELDKPEHNGPEWQCRECAEANPGTFDICWQCATPLQA